MIRQVYLQKWAESFGQHRHQLKCH